MLDRLSEIELAAELPVVPDALTVSVPIGHLRALRRALAAEEERGKLRLEAARLFLSGADDHATLRTIREWAERELGAAR